MRVTRLESAPGSRGATSYQTGRGRRAREVVVADRAREFAFVVSATGTRWGYQFRAVDDGTLVTESWDFPSSAVAVFEERFGDDAEAQIASRSELAGTGIPATLAAIKKAAEST